MKYKNILITGAAGFIGHALCKKLIDSGCRIYGIDNINDYYDPGLKYDRLADLGVLKINAQKWDVESISNKYNNFVFVRKNIEDKITVPNLFKEKKFDAVIHLAAQAGVRYSLENPMAYVNSNLVGFVNILECCRNNNVKHLVYASSSSVYGENKKVPFSESDIVDYPVSLYAATKKANELMAHSYSHLYGLQTTGLRFFTVYGPWGRPDMAPMLFASSINKGEAIKVFNNGNMKRDFTYIDDIVQGVFIALMNPPLNREENKNNYLNSSSSYQLFNIGNGSPIHLLEFIKVLEEEIGKPAIKTMLEMQSGDVPKTWADTTSLNTLGYESKTGIREGVKNFVDWFQRYNEKL